MRRFQLFYPLFAVAGFIIWWKLSETKEIQFGANEVAKQQSFWIVVYGFIITLLGVIIGACYRELQSLKDRGQTHIENLKLFLKNVFTSIDLWMGLFGAPIVYALLWKSLDGGSIAGLTVIALQNGFCCTIIISNLVKKNAT
ncbi:MAG TPA: hypothetical protein VGQ53_13085 [Chitinophagaceae bacterium]|jgi:hypothetical protein|nr:hypothetical protein [Chitinophagaceae bacterium]